MSAWDASEWPVVCRAFRAGVYFRSRPVVFSPESQRLVLRYGLIERCLWRSDELTIDALRGVVHFRWQSWLVPQIAEVPIADLQLVLIARQGGAAGEFALELRDGPVRLLLFSTFDRQVVQELFEQLAPFFPSRASDRSAEAAEPDVWRRVCRRFQQAPYFGTWPAAYSPDSQRMVIRNKRHWYLSFAALLTLIAAAGSLLTGMSSYVGPLVSYLGPTAFFLGLGAAAIAGMLHCEELEIDALRGVIRFRYGWHPWTTQVEAPLQGLRLLLFENALSRTRTYGLEIHRGSHSLRLLNWPRLRDLQPFFERLAMFFPLAASNWTTTPRPPQVFPERPIQLTHYLERGRSHYLQVQGNRAVLRGAFGASLALCILALTFPAFAWWLNWMWPLPNVVSVNMASHRVVWAISAFVIGIGWWVWPRTVVIEADNWLRVAGCQWQGHWRGPLHASDIAAVQICDSREAYQVNLIAKGPEFCRVNVLCDSDPVRAEDVAFHLARILRVPLQTHWRS